MYAFADYRPGTERMLWRPSVVHRLDKLTEGIQLVAKTKDAAVYLQNQFMTRKIKKRCVSSLCGTQRNEEGSGWIRRDLMEVDCQVFVGLGF